MMPSDFMLLAKRLSDFIPEGNNKPKLNEWAELGAS
jgi:hypothetical protein